MCWSYHICTSKSDVFVIKYTIRVQILHKLFSCSESAAASLQ